MRKFIETLLVICQLDTLYFTVYGISLIIFFPLIEPIFHYTSYWFLQLSYYQLLDTLKSLLIVLVFILTNFWNLTMLSPNTICRNLLQFLNTNKKNIKGETRKLIFAWRMSNWCPFWAHPPLTQRRQIEKINVKIKNRKSTIRSSHWKCSVRKGVLINFVKFTGKHLCQSLFFN